MGVLLACMCIHHMIPWCHADQKREMALLGLKLLMVVCGHVGGVN